MCPDVDLRDRVGENGVTGSVVRFTTYFSYVSRGGMGWDGELEGRGKATVGSFKKNFPSV